MQPPMVVNQADEAIPGLDKFPNGVRPAHGMSESHGCSCDCRPKRLVRSWANWIVPSAVLIVMPKCPVCLAAYITLVTGIGVSLTLAAYLRFFLVAICLVTLAVVGGRQIVIWLKARTVAAKQTTI